MKDKNVFAKWLKVVGNKNITVYKNQYYSIKKDNTIIVGVKPLNKKHSKRFLKKVAKMQLKYCK